MKKEIVFLCVFLFTGLSTVKAGPITSSGGGAFVCRDSSGQILSSRMVDLWESEHTPFRWPNRSGAGVIPITYTNDTSPEEQFNAALAKLSALDGDLADQVRIEQNNIFSQKNVLPDAISIALPDDLKLGYYPTGCPAEGMMLYNGESGLLDIKNDIFQELVTNTDIAAAWMHEALYKVKRETELRGDAKSYVENSKKLRRLVACIFSTDPLCLAPRVASFEGDSDFFKFSCDSLSTQFDIFFRKDSAWPRVDTKMIITKAGARKIHYPYIINRADGSVDDFGGYTNFILLPRYYSLQIESPFEAYDDSAGMSPLSNLGIYLKIPNEFIKNLPSMESLTFEVSGVYSMLSSGAMRHHLPNGSEEGACARVY